MEKISFASGKELAWMQPKTFQRRYELRAGETVVAMLEFKSAFGSLALASTGQERWTFKRMGFFNPRVTVRREGEETDLGTYRPKWSSTEGTLELAGGRTYHWKVANFWATRFVFSDSKGNPWVTYQSGAMEAKARDFFKDQARVKIKPGVMEHEDLALLVLAGWYLIVLHKEDSAAVVAAVS